MSEKTSSDAASSDSAGPRDSIPSLVAAPGALRSTKSSIQVRGVHRLESSALLPTHSTSDSKVRTQVPSVLPPLKEWEADGYELLRWTTKERERDVAEYQRRLALRENAAGRDYDPYAHRLRHDYSDWAATMHMVNGIMNLGVFFTTYNFFHIGVILAVILLIAMVALSNYCVYMALRNQYAICCSLKEPWLGLPRMVEHAIRHGPPIMRWFAPYSRCFVYGIIIVKCLSVSAAYGRVAGEYIKNMLDSQFSQTLGVHILMTMPIFVLLSTFFNLKLLLYESIGTNLITCFGTIVFLSIVFQQYESQIVNMNVAYIDPLEFAHFMVGVLFCLNNIPLMQYIERNMRNPQKMIGICGVFSRTLIFITIIILVIALPSYCYFGEGKIVFSPITVPRSALRTTLMIVTTISCFLSFPLCIIVAYDIIWEMSLKSALRDYPKNLQDLVGAVLRIGLALVSVTLSISIPNFFAWDRLASSLSVPLLVLMFPAIIEMCLCWEMKNFGRFHYAFFKDFFMICFAVYICISGCIQTIFVLSDGDHKPPWK